MNEPSISKMTGVNKTGNTRETVYDRCAYVGCYNGKFINGRRLFHFPSETDRRLEMWIERSGNFRLRTWAATSLRKAGLCGDHFDDKCFTNATRKALRRNVVPRHYTEEMKLRKMKSEKIGETNGNNENKTTIDSAEENDDDPLIYNCLLSIPGETTTMVQADDGSSLYLSEFALNDPNEKLGSDRTPSPIVEFIVEELDEILLRDDESNVPEDCYYTAQESTRSDDSILEYKQKIKVKNDESSEHSMSCIAPEIDVRTCVVRRTKSESSSGQSETFGDESITAMNDAKPISRTIITVDNNKNIEHMLSKLQCDKQHLQRTVRMLKEKIRRAEAGRKKLKNCRVMPKNVDEFLDTQECTNPVARAMVKLALHKQNSPYTKEEKDFATQIYLHSSSIFGKLRASGCNLPGKTTMKRWIDDNDGQPSTCHFIKSNDGPDDTDDVDVDDDDDDDAHGNHKDIDEIKKYVGAEGMVDQMDEQSGRVAKHFEKHIENAEGHDEDVNQSTPDYDAAQDYFK